MSSHAPIVKAATCGHLPRFGLATEYRMSRSVARLNKEAVSGRLIWGVLSANWRNSTFRDQKQTFASWLVSRSTEHARFFRTDMLIRPLGSDRSSEASTSLQPSRTPSSHHAETVPSLRQPKPVQALHLKPLKREAEFGIPSCDLQLRSFSVQPLEFFADFALRAAYYLGLPASGPVPLPRITERWTVPKSHFIFKKSQENFERVTLRRLIQIKDGNPETVQLWLAYLRKHQFYGVGMKANTWEFGRSGQIQDHSQGLEGLNSAWSHLGQVTKMGTADKVEKILSSRRFKEAAGLRQPLTSDR